jgi:hypothetical protein
MKRCCVQYHLGLGCACTSIVLATGHVHRDIMPMAVETCRKYWVVREHLDEEVVVVSRIDMVVTVYSAHHSCVDLRSIPKHCHEKLAKQSHLQRCRASLALDYGKLIALLVWIVLKAKLDA